MYTDPGIAQMIMAAIVGLIVAVPTYLLLFRYKVKGWIDAIRKHKK